MTTRTQLYKIIAIVLLFLIFLQYLYLYPVKLNFSYTKAPLLSPDFKPEKSLFSFKTATFNKKRSETPDFNFDSGSNGNSESANTNQKDSLPKSNLVSILDFRNRNINGSTPTNIISAVSSARNAVEFRSNTTKSGVNIGDEIQPTYCPTRPSTLLGLLKVYLGEPPSLADIGRMHSDITLGGRYKSPNCTSKDKVAIIVPFRDREEHLRLFLFNLLPFLKRQQIEFNIFVIEQGSATKEEPFNRAMLFNVGFAEANKRGEFDCFIFHDVDLIPENDFNLYNCPFQPRHMSVAVDKMQYKLPYRNLFGGISALTKEHFLRVNGFSNSFWGWGAEDDDMAGRIAFSGLYISRPPPNIARYKMLKHKQQKLNNQRYRVLQKGKTRFRTDGLSNLKYNVEQVVLENTYTLIRVQLAKPS